MFLWVLWVYVTFFRGFLDYVTFYGVLWVYGGSKVWCCLSAKADALLREHGVVFIEKVFIVAGNLKVR